MVTTDQRLDTYTRQSLWELQRQGVRLILASGRAPEGVFPLAKALGFDTFGGFIIAFNGALAMDYRTRHILFESCLSRSTVRHLWHDAIRYDLGIMTYGRDCIVTGTVPDAFMVEESSNSGLPLQWQREFPNSMPAKMHQCLLTGDERDLDRLSIFLSKRYIGMAEFYHSEPVCLEITPSGIDKSEALKQLLGSLGIAPSHIVACGNSYNDIGMLRYAGVGVAMANAPKAVKTASNYVTLRSNDECGIVEVVIRYFC